MSSQGPPNSSVARQRRLAAISNHIPSGQLLRYLLVGTWNTLFGYGLYVLLTWVLSGHMRYAYMAASAAANVIAISVACVGYRFFVFRTKGNFLKQYLRCFAVYSVSAAIGLALLPFAVEVTAAMISNQTLAPYLAGAFLAAGNVLLSFFGHKRFSFRA